MQALILAAGMGKRLGELTSDRTKCMVELHGRTLLERMLQQLSECGIAHTTLVVGYYADKVRGLIGDRFANMEISYIDNPVYDRTNNIYSLFLAKECLLREDTLILESDLVLEESILVRLLADPRPDLAVVAKCQAWMDGTVLSVDEEDNITSFISKKHVDFNEIDRFFKTVNIYRFSREFARDHYVPFLEAYCKAVGHSEYYEQVLRVITLLERHTVKALRLGEEKWYEIDDIQDLAIAETLFAPEDSAFESYCSRHGGFWRFPFLLDYCYLVNPFFPPKRLIDEMKAYHEMLMLQYPSCQSVNRHLAAKMFGILPEQLVVGNGAAELIHALQADWMGTTGIVRPSFEEYAQRTPRHLLRIFEPDGDSLSYTVDDLLHFVADTGVDRLVLVNPDNPTGHFLSETEVCRLATALESQGRELLLDESFADFAVSENRFTMLSNEKLAMHPNLTVVRSISKSYGVPGIRLGVAASLNRERIAQLEVQLPVWNVNSFGEFFLQIFGKYEAAYRHACDLLAAERARISDLLAATGIMRVFPSAANFVMCEVLSPLTPSHLVRKLLCDHDILVRDCSGKQGIQGRPYVRIAVRGVKDNDRLIAALNRISDEIHSVA